jgi:hypothetical protein
MFTRAATHTLWNISQQALLSIWFLFDESLWNIFFTAWSAILRDSTFLYRRHRVASRYGWSWDEAVGEVTDHRWTNAQPSGMWTVISKTEVRRGFRDFFLRGLVMRKEEIKRIVFPPNQSVALYKRCVHIINTRILYEALSHSLMLSLGIYVVSHSHDQKYEIVCLGNFACNMEIYLKDWIAFKILSSPKWHTTIKDLITHHWGKCYAFIENCSDLNRP